MLVIRELTKTYSSGVQALRGVSLDLSPGVFGLLGPNGSGKTTLMKILATLLEPDSGTIEMNGVDLITRKDHTRRMLGYLPQDFGLYPTLTAWQMLDYLAKLKGVIDKKERHNLIDALLDRVNLSAERSQRLGGFSGGMRRRIGIAQAVSREPRLLIDQEANA
jgi:ABC-type multidrug transport system ATPase subunit